MDNMAFGRMHGGKQHMRADRVSSFGMKQASLRSDKGRSRLKMFLLFILVALGIGICIGLLFLIPKSKFKDALISMIGVVSFLVSLLLSWPRGTDVSDQARSEKSSSGRNCSGYNGNTNTNGYSRNGSRGENIVIVNNINVQKKESFFSRVAKYYLLSRIVEGATGTPGSSSSTLASSSNINETSEEKRERKKKEEKRNGIVFVVFMAIALIIFIAVTLFYQRGMSVVDLILRILVVCTAGIYALAYFAGRFVQTEHHGVCILVWVTAAVISAFCGTSKKARRVCASVSIAAIIVIVLTLVFFLLVKNGSKSENEIRDTSGRYSHTFNTNEQSTGAGVNVQSNARFQASGTTVHDVGREMPSNGTNRNTGFNGGQAPSAPPPYQSGPSPSHHSNPLLHGMRPPPPPYQSWSPPSYDDGPIPMDNKAHSQQPPQYQELDGRDATTNLTNNLYPSINANANDC